MEGNFDKVVPFNEELKIEEEKVVDLVEKNEDINNHAVVEQAKKQQNLFA